MGSISAEPVSEPIAIIGLSCKFAGDARSPEEVWKMLEEGRNAWSEVPSSRFNLKGFFHPDPEKLDTVCAPDNHQDMSGKANHNGDASRCTFGAVISCMRKLHILMLLSSTSPRNSRR
jgi:hypothetical protein